MFILPFNEDGYVGRLPYAVMGVAVANALLLAATYTLSTPEAVFARFGFVPAHPVLLTPFSSMFLHAGILHLLGNMFFLWMFGYRIENTFGALGFGLMYALCGLGGTWLHYLMSPTSPIPCVGASGAISGVMGCYFVLFPMSRFNLEVFFFRFHLTSIPTHTHGAIGVWLAEQTALGLISQAARFSSTAFWAHVGGFGTGALVTWLLLLASPRLRNRGDQPFIVRVVKGAVLDKRGKIVPNARIEIYWDSRRIADTVTNQAGRFAIEVVPDGHYRFTISKEGFASYEGNLIVKKKARYNLPIRVRLSVVADAATSLAASPGSSH